MRILSDVNIKMRILSDGDGEQARVFCDAENSLGQIQKVTAMLIDQ